MLMAASLLSNSSTLAVYKPKAGGPLVGIPSWGSPLGFLFPLLLIQLWTLHQWAASVEWQDLQTT